METIKNDPHIKLIGNLSENQDINGTLYVKGIKNHEKIVRHKLI